MGSTMHRPQRLFDTVADAMNTAAAHITTSDCKSRRPEALQNKDGLRVVVDGELAPDSV